MTDPLPADHEARQRAAAVEPNAGVPMVEAIIALDTLAILAGIPAPGSSVRLPDDVVTTITPPLSPDAAREAVAAYALRRCAAWATALVEALPRCPECAQGKPVNCTGQTLTALDELVACQGPA